MQDGAFALGAGLITGVDQLGERIPWAAPRFPDCGFRVHLRGEL